MLNDINNMITILLSILPAVVTFLITRFGYVRKYQNEIKQLETSISKDKAQIDKSIYETYDSIIGNFNKHFADVLKEKDELRAQVRRLGDYVAEQKAKSGGCTCEKS